MPTAPVSRPALRPALLLAFALSACGPRPAEAPPAVGALFQECQTGDYDAALAALLAAADDHPGSPDVAVATGMCRWAEVDRTADIGLAEVAAGDFSRALTLLAAGRPSGYARADVLRYRAFLRGAVADGGGAGWGAALRDLDEAARLDPSVRSYVDRAAARAMAGDGAGAAADLETARTVAGADSAQLARVEEAARRPALAAVLGGAE